MTGPQVKIHCNSLQQILVHMKDRCAKAKSKKGKQLEDCLKPAAGWIDNWRPRITSVAVEMLDSGRHPDSNAIKYSVWLTHVPGSAYTNRRDTVFARLS
jgi:hypothetical protein